MQSWAARCDHERHDHKRSDHERGRHDHEAKATNVKATDGTTMGGTTMNGTSMGDVIMDAGDTVKRPRRRVPRQRTARLREVWPRRTWTHGARLVGVSGCDGEAPLVTASKHALMLDDGRSVPAYPTKNNRLVNIAWRSRLHFARAGLSGRCLNQTSPFQAARQAGFD